MSIIAIDFETSGYAPTSACSLGMARLDIGRITATWQSLIRPPSPRVIFSDVHGLTWNMLKNQPVFADLWPEILDFMQGASVLVAHNALFDRGVLLACCEALGTAPPPVAFACTLKGARAIKAQLGLGRLRLCDLCAHFGIELDHHNALSDALGAGQLYFALRRMGVEEKDMILPLRPAASHSR